MAIVKQISSRASIGRIITYVNGTEKTEEKLISGIECSPATVIEEMKATKAAWGKEDKRQYYHFIHSFPPGEKITLEEANKMAIELCSERFKGHEILVTTHKDTKHIHSHIIVNSVNYENGRKLHWTKYDLEKMKADSNDMCRERSLSVPEKGQKITTYTKDKYKVLEKAVYGDYKSYVLDCYKAVDNASQTALSKDDFVGKMKEAGYETNWSDKRKHITFTDTDGNKVRAANLEKTFSKHFGKESLQNGFDRNLADANARAIADSTSQPGNRQRDVTDTKITKLRAAISKSESIIGNGERNGAGHGIVRETGISHTNDSNAAITKLRGAVRKSKSAVADDERKRTDRAIDRQSRQREPDRARESKTQRRSRELPERDR